MLMIRCSMRVVIGGGICVMVMVVHGALLMIAGAKLDVAGERIGEVNVVMDVVDAVHQRDVGLSGQHDGERHAKDGDRASQRDKPSAQLRLTFGGPTRRKRWNLAQLRPSATPRYVPDESHRDKTPANHHGFSASRAETVPVALDVPNRRRFVNAPRNGA